MAVRSPLLTLRASRWRTKTHRKASALLAQDEPSTNSSWVAGIQKRWQPRKSESFTLKHRKPQLLWSEDPLSRTAHGARLDLLRL
jgi:hypothetical protein